LPAHNIVVEPLAPYPLCSISLFSLMFHRLLGLAANPSFPHIEACGVPFYENGIRNPASVVNGKWQPRVCNASPVQFLGAEDSRIVVGKGL
jgi:hypothetical protein